MESAYRNEAVRLLVESTRLSIRAEKLLNMLIATNPVAPRGQPTMISAAKLIDAMGLSCLAYPRHYELSDEIKWIFSELAGASWQAPLKTQGSTGVFLDMYWMLADSVFIHFQLNGEFLAVLNQVGQRSAVNLR